MNEKIKQLAEHAGIFRPKEFYQHIDALQLEKFAELIVAECVKAVKPDTEYPMESVDIVEEFHRGYWVGCNDSTMRIKEHFGVEE
jgi:hypothetical protein